MEEISVILELAITPGQSGSVGLDLAAKHGQRATADSPGSRDPSASMGGMCDCLCLVD